ncbi:hypothetical protein SBA2_360047 [Acidobacteriia bacterium SbA2]|nr:hypothetical protein SBA2_360047 [Acidobacteriia bacterium SbA2]
MLPRSLTILINCFEQIIFDLTKTVNYSIISCEDEAIYPHLPGCLNQIRRSAGGLPRRDPLRHSCGLAVFHGAVDNRPVDRNRISVMA